MNILLKAATIIDPNSKFDAKTVDILIKDGAIAAIEDNINASNEVDVISYQNLHVSPGWFDSSVSYGEPGFEERETLANGLEVAAKSGFSAIALNPITQPVIDNSATIRYLHGQAHQNAVTLSPMGTLTLKGEGLELAELYDMKTAGAIAFSDYQRPIKNPNLLKLALLYAQNFNGLVLSYPQDHQIASHGMVNEGTNSTLLGLKGIPALAEELQITRDLFILEYTGGKLHIPTISTAKSVALIKEAKQKGLQVSCSVSVHHLSLTDDQLSTFDTNMKVRPPLRTQDDVEALLTGITDGTIDMITSDHSPMDIEHKKVEFDNAKYGTIGLESAFGVINKILGARETVKMFTNGRRVFELQSPSIDVGNQADLTLFNPDKTYTFSNKDIKSTSKNSAFMGSELKGEVFGIIANKQKVLQ
ncbi:dihydroorotase [Aquimarina brevivitae]|uniref:Dihydroorotase n=1 Tax=Aquimarina brevivitae TaxID=323412 RepID=A0A4Q7P4M3_9FLAO|nr:dihydroorotase [Aquimarina brevivitae]RZS93642.1 dihydroorotase [Aquimarina brevivitae]